MDSWDINPKGSAVALTTRGKAFTLRNFAGGVSQHGALDGIRYRATTWLADGKRIVAVSDDGSDPRLVVSDGWRDTATGPHRSGYRQCIEPFCRAKGDLVAADLVSNDLAAS